MVERYNTGNPRPSNSMKDLSDNAQAYDDFMNSENDTFIDRLENEKDTLAGAQKKMAAAAEESVQDARQNLIPLSRQYMTLAAAQADIANIPAGSTTYYRSPDDSALAIEVINNGGTLEPTGRKMPSASALNQVLHQATIYSAYASQAPARAGLFVSDVDEEYLWSIADENGVITERINADFIHRYLLPVIIQNMKLGSAEGKSGLFAGEKITLGVDAAGNAITGALEVSRSDDMLYGVTDEQGRCLFRFGFQGQFVQSGTEQSADTVLSDDLYKFLTTNGQCLYRIDSRGKFRAVLHEDVISQIIEETGGEKTLFEPRLLADIIHIQMHGQSLGVGIGSTRISSTATLQNVLMPSGGIEDGQTSSEGIEGLPLTSTSLVAMNPEIAKKNVENPLYGLCAQLQGMLSADGENVAVMGSSSAHGSYRISQLDKESGSPQYAAAVAQNTAYAGYSSADAKSFLSHVLCSIQGESDISVGTAPAEYLRRMNNLIADYQDDVGQGMPPVMVTYQTSSHTRRTPNSSPDIAHTQLLAANTNPYIFMACPTYVFPYNADGVHMPGNSYRWMGCYFGRAIHSILTTGDWKPLQPEAIYRNGRVVTVVMHVPAPPLVLDTDMVTDPGDYGFEVWGDTDGTRKTIQSVTVSGNRVTLVLDSDPAQAVVVKYAQGVTGSNAGPTTGARGNLRDSDATLAYCRDITATDPNSPYKLYNWCPIFSLKEGFSWGQ